MFRYYLWLNVFPPCDIIYYFPQEENNRREYKGCLWMTFSQRRDQPKQHKYPTLWKWAEVGKITLNVVWLPILNFLAHSTPRKLSQRSTQERQPAQTTYTRNLSKTSKTGHSMAHEISQRHTGNENILREFRKAKLVVILKSNKPENDTYRYRPISQISICYKLLERVIYNRIYETIDKVLPSEWEQAGFKQSRSCTDQVLALLNFIKSGFEVKTKKPELRSLTSHQRIIPFGEMGWYSSSSTSFSAKIRCNSWTTWYPIDIQIKVFINGERYKTKILSIDLPVLSVYQRHAWNHLT